MATLVGVPRFRHQWDAPEGLSGRSMLTGREVAKFGVMVGFLSILFDASIGQAVFWESDPYWTYWITKTLLVTSVFSLATAFAGIGLAQGALATAINTAILGIYFQFLSPIGLPLEPQWLSFDHLWVTGVPVHFGVVFAGYAASLWVWRRRADVSLHWQPAPARLGAYALLAAALAVLLDGLIVQWMTLQQNPGLTYFVARTLIAIPFFFWLATYVALDAAGLVAGSVLLALVWTTYSTYLGPTGLPWGEIHYAGFQALWLQSLPGQIVAALAGGWFAAALLGLDRPRTLATEATDALVHPSELSEVA